MDSLEPGMLVVARYRLEERLAADLLDVQPWAATDQILDRPVRVSLIAGPGAALTLDAARRAALISDTHLTRVLDVLHDGGRDFVVTEPYAGASLADLLDQGPLSAGAARAIIGSAAKALESARRRGVHHGALRPSAIRIHKGIVRVTGLGIDGTVPHSRAQATGDVASREDAVSLVALLHYALTGVLPLAGSAAASRDPESSSPLGSGDVLAPPRDVVPTVPKDLDTLCVVTLGPHDDGPHTPGELVKELEPWDEEDIPVVDEPDVDTAAVEEPVTATSVNRQSVRVFGSGAAPSAGSTMPGTPPPAGPVRRQSTGRIPRVGGTGAIPVTTAATTAAAATMVPAGTAAATSAQGVPPAILPQGAGGPARPQVGAFTATGAALPPLSPVPPAPSGPPRPAAPRSAADQGAPLSAKERARRFHFNPTPVVLTLMLALLVVGGVVAKNTLFSGYAPAIVQPDREPGAAPAGPDVDAPGEPADATPPTEAPPAAVAPVIVSGAQVSLPGNDLNDHPELAGKAIDGDVVTAWYSLTYKTPQFGGYTHGVGYLVTLEQSVPVSSIFLSTKNTGGNVEIRATDAADPTGGTLLASGPLQMETAFSFESPVETSTIVIWITELPQDVPSGENRAHIFEIAVA